MRDKLLAALRSHAKGHIDKHVANLETALNNPTAIPEHMDWVETAEQELESISKYHDQLEVLDKYFKD